MNARPCRPVSSMTLALLSGIALSLPTPLPTHAQPGPGDGPIPLEKLLELSSVVGGETPVWSTDGEHILFASSLGGGFLTVGTDGAFPTRVAVDPGGAGHFLAQQEPRWSPDGEWISFISDKSGHPEIWLYSLSSGEERQLTDLGARINAYQWSPDGRAVALSGDRFGSYDIWVVSVSGGEARRLTTDDRYEVFPSWAPEGGRLFYVRLDEAWVDHEILEIDANGGEPRLVTTDRDFFDYGAGAKFGHPMPSPDGERLLFPSHRSGWINYWTVARGGGEAVPIAAESRDQTHARWSPDGRWIAYVSNHDGTYELRVVPSSGGEPRVLVAPEGMGVVSSPEWSPDGASISYTFETPTELRDLYVVSVDGGATRRLTNSRPAGDLMDRVVAPRKVRYESTDGFTISAYLYAPPGAESGTETYPGVLWIHGGPTGQFRDSFQQHVQYFVQRGYAVLLPNIRGSSGYGRAFEDANNQCWGRCDLDDVRAGVEFLGSLGYVDLNRVGITGTSYGGCMSMAAVAFAPGLFQAAIPLSGYGDWFHFYEEQELRHVKLLDYELGSPEADADVYEYVSPIFSIDEVETPVFLAHGEGLFPGSLASANYAAELERHYKPFRYETYPNETYYVYGRENRARLLQDMLGFFEQYLAPTGSDGAQSHTDTGGGTW